MHGFEPSIISLRDAIFPAGRKGPATPGKPGEGKVMLNSDYIIPNGASVHKVARHITNLFFVGYEDAERNPPFGGGRLSESGESAAEHIAHMLRLVRSETQRLQPAERKQQLQRDLVFLCACWLAVTGQMPEGYFPEPEVGGPPAMNSGAGFCFLMLKASGRTFTAEEFRAGFVWARKMVRRKRPIIDALFAT